MTTGGNGRTNVFARRFAAEVWMALLPLAGCMVTLRAQTIEIKLIDGRTGRPITDRSLLNVWVGGDRLFPMEVRTDKKTGVAALRLTEKDSEINVPECKGEQADLEKVQANPDKKDTQEFNRKYKNCVAAEVSNPIVRYGDAISVQTLPGNVSWKAGGNGRSAAYVPCWLDLEKTKDYWNTITGFSTKDVLERGVVTAKTCGKASVSANPGELVLFVRMPSNREYLGQALKAPGSTHF